MMLALRNLLTQIRQANISAVPCNQNFFSVLTSPARISRRTAELNQVDIRGAVAIHRTSTLTPSGFFFYCTIGVCKSKNEIPLRP